MKFNGFNDEFVKFKFKNGLNVEFIYVLML